MPKVRCYVGNLTSSNSEYPQIKELELGGRSIPEYFREASSLPDGTPAIDLAIDWSWRDTLDPYFVPNDQNLQESLTALLNNSNSTVPKGELCVGLILADEYRQYPNAYGFMFDLGFPNPEDSCTPEYDSKPREGCAVFLDKIWAVRRPSEQDFRDQVACTAIHELGHVFNLWHIPEPESFMTQRTDDRVFTARRFVQDHENYLQEAADPACSGYVLPGGSKFGDRGHIGPPNGDLPMDAVIADSTLSLEIELSHREFWYFEPVELDVRLAVKHESSGVVTIPDEIDPGYERFQIWITRPDGEKRRYRSSIHHCVSLNTRDLKFGEPFERDISIFGQSGGYTFAMAGKYEIQVVLRLSPMNIVSSNVVECEVRRINRDSKMYATMYESLSPTPVAKLLYYRSRIPPAPLHDRLRSFVNDYKSTESAAAVHYSLGRALLSSALQPQEVNRSADLERQGLYHIAEAMNHPRLSTHRRNISQRLMREHG